MSLLDAPLTFVPSPLPVPPVDPTIVFPELEPATIPFPVEAEALEAGLGDGLTEGLVDSIPEEFSNVAESGANYGEPSYLGTWTWEQWHQGVWGGRSNSGFAGEPYSYTREGPVNLGWTTNGVRYVLFDSEGTVFGGTQDRYSNDRGFDGYFRNFVFTLDTANPIEVEPSPSTPIRPRPSPLEPDEGEEGVKRVPGPLIGFEIPTELFLPSPIFLPGQPDQPAPAPELPPGVDPSPTPETEPEIIPPAPTIPPETVPSPSEEEEEEVKAPPLIDVLVNLPELIPTSFLPSEGVDIGDLLKPQPEPTKAPIFIPPGVCVCTVEIEREGKKTRDNLREALEELLGKDGYEIYRAFCDTNGQEPVDNLRTEEYQELYQGLSAISQEIAAIRLQLGVCPVAQPVNEQPSVIATGNSTHARSVEYVELTNTVRQVELIIVGELSTEIRLYKNEETDGPQGKFGSLSVSYQGVTGGYAPNAFHQWCWTRRTILEVGKAIRNPRFVRVAMKPTISWVLYDTGLRY